MWRELGKGTFGTSNESHFGFPSIGHRRRRPEPSTDSDVVLYCPGSAVVRNVSACHRQSQANHRLFTAPSRR